MSKNYCDKCSVEIIGPDGAVISYIEFPTQLDPTKPGSRPEQRDLMLCKECKELTLKFVKGN